MAGYEAVKVVGLKELRKGLKAMDEKGTLDELKDAHQRVGQMVVEAARGAASGVSKMAVSAAESLTAARTANAARIRYGGGGYPYAMGAEFGAYRNQLRYNVGGNPPRSGMGFNQFQGFRGSGDGAGYFLYPTIRAERDRTIDMYGDDMERILNKFVPK